MASAQLISWIVCDEPVRPRQQGVHRLALCSMRRVGVIWARSSGPRLTSTILASTSFTYTSITRSTFDPIITSASVTYTDYSTPYSGRVIAWRPRPCQAWNSTTPPAHVHCCWRCHVKKKTKARRQRWIHLHRCEETVCQRYALAVHSATEGKYCFSMRSRNRRESNLRFCWMPI